MTNNLFLVDTSAWIFALKRNYVPVIKDRIADLLRKNLVLTTGIALHPKARVISPRFKDDG